MAKFCIVVPAMWRPPFNIADLADAKITRSPLSTTGSTKSDGTDLIVFLNGIQKQVQQLTADLSKDNISVKEVTDKTYLISRMRLEVTRLISRFHLEYPDYVITTGLSNKNNYTIVSKAFVSGFCNR